MNTKLFNFNVIVPVPAPR